VKASDDLIQRRGTVVSLELQAANRTLVMNAIVDAMVALTAENNGCVNYFSLH
jgi:hypothetical protein